jgi:hypothetical protein
MVADREAWKRVVEQVKIHKVVTPREEEGAPPIILNLSTRGWLVVSVTPWLLYSRKRTQVPVELEAGWAPTEILIVDRPALILVTIPTNISCIYTLC